MTLLDEEPDYTTYSLGDLRDVERRIDRSRYSERYERIRQELARRADLPPEQPAPEAPPTSSFFPHYDTHRRTSALLIGGMASTNLGLSLFRIATQGLDEVRAHPEVSDRLLIGSLLILTLTVLGAVLFYQDEKRWSRHLLWPAGVLTALTFDGKAVIGIYVLWVLWKSRAGANVGASSAV